MSPLPAKQVEKTVSSAVLLHITAALAELLQSLTLAPRVGRRAPACIGARGARRGCGDRVARESCSDSRVARFDARATASVTYFMVLSVGLSFGFAHAALVASDAGRPTLVLVGGIGCMNHLS